MDNKTKISDVVANAAKQAGGSIVLKDYVRFQLARASSARPATSPPKSRPRRNRAQGLRSLCGAIARTASPTGGMPSLGTVGGRS
jgi:hypothetical protein